MRLVARRFRPSRRQMKNLTANLASDLEAWTRRLALADRVHHLLATAHRSARTHELITS